MDKELIQKLKEKLEQDKDNIEKELETFAVKDPKLKHDWDSIFPKDAPESGGQNMEYAADQVEEYSTRLPIEYSLEIRLKDINLAIEKIKKGNYGFCEKCNKKIILERLKVHPEAKFCMECEKE